jgi:hypothetical protein
MNGWERAECNQTESLFREGNAGAGIVIHYLGYPQFFPGYGHEIGTDNNLVMGVLQQGLLNDYEDKTGAGQVAQDLDGNALEVLIRFYLGLVVLPEGKTACHILAEPQLDKTGFGPGHVIGSRRGKRVYQPKCTIQSGNSSSFFQ